MAETFKIVAIHTGYVLKQSAKILVNLTNLVSLRIRCMFLFSFFEAVGQDK